MSKPVLAQRLRLLRREKGLTQMEIAQLINISNTTLSQYESNKRMPGFEVLCQLADIYGSTTDYLLGITEQRTMPSSKITLSPQELTCLEQIKRLDSDFISVLCGTASISPADVSLLKQLISVFVTNRQD